MAHRRSIAAFVLCLAGAVALADPEGYQGGEGRPVGTPHVSGGLSITVRASAVEPVRKVRTWSCGGVAVDPAGAFDLATVSLAISNPSDEPISTQLANMDLVLRSGEVREGTCAKAGAGDVTAVSLAAHRSKTVRVQFLVPRRAVPKVLVYNDDDFPALFALPAPRPAKVRPSATLVHPSR